MADVIYCLFPQPSEMRERKTLREHKYVAAQMNRHDPQAEEALFAFHDPRSVVAHHIFVSPPWPPGAASARFSDVLRRQVTPNSAQTPPPGSGKTSPLYQRNDDLNP